MKRFIPLFVALFFSTICFAQNNVSIKDFCYYDRDMNTIETHSQDQIIKSLKKKGFVISKTEYSKDEGAGGYETTFKYVTMYQKRTGTTVLIFDDFGPESITFNNANVAKSFAREAVNAGYAEYSNGEYMIVNSGNFGVSSFSIKGKSVFLSISVP